MCNGSILILDIKNDDNVEDKPDTDGSTLMAFTQFHEKFYRYKIIYIYFTLNI